MKHFKYLALALLIVPALYLLAFGPRNDAPTPPGRVVVEYWEAWTGEEAAAMRLIVNDFNSSQDKIFVRYVSASNVNQKTLVATAAGVPPDIAGLWDNNLAQFAAQDALMPLEDFAAHNDPPITSATYLPVFWDACHYDGHLYALISTPSSVALHYNKDDFREAGLDPNHPPQTLQELDHDAERIDKRDAHGRLIRTGYLPTEPGWYVNYTYLWFGGSIWDEAHHKFTLTDRRVVDAFTWVQSYSRRLGKGAVNEFRGGVGNFDSPQNPFISGTLAMTQQGPWMAHYFLTHRPSMDGLAPGEADDLNLPVEVRQKRAHWAASVFPSAVAGLKDVTFCGFDTLVIPRGARHPREAFTFIAYVNKQPVMEKLCNLHCKSSPLQSVSMQFLAHHRNPYIRVFQDLTKSANAHTVPKIPIFPEVDAEISVLVQQLALMDEQPEPTLAKLQVRLQHDYDSFMDKQNARKLLAASAK